ncbi:hypothetical protein P8A22_03500 [Streptomyces laculatispora]|uniref:Uncharacterized protein n=1 Tax=Streptomyces laculatispora TaxID=887464 RepID=A0ABY9HX74_9ACTN|nr:hypothetical protein [Streptomyces laculatispora]WLQ39175.1 hypothetical protein P8A22_03500 [Streptomyces laculatispora]
MTGEVEVLGLHVASGAPAPNRARRQPPREPPASRALSQASAATRPWTCSYVIQSPGSPYVPMRAGAPAARA